MKKYWKFAFIPMIIFLVGAMIGFYQERNEREQIGKTHLYFPFTLEQIENVEIYYYKTSSDIEKYVVAEVDSMKYLYDTFQTVSLESTQASDVEPWQVTAYRFNLTDDSRFELIYEGYGVKNGVLTMLDNNISYFTAADLNKLAVQGLEPMKAEKSELPN